MPETKIPPLPVLDVVPDAIRAPVSAPVPSPPPVEAVAGAAVTATAAAPKLFEDMLAALQPKE